VALITQERATPFVHGTLGAGWLCWFRRRHPKLILMLAQGLDNNRARGLCPINVSTFYSNLSELYEKYKYPPSNIWNCDESGAHTRQNGGAYVLTKRGSRVVHSVIPNFYIFKRMCMRHNYIRRCESGATMTMSRKAWMTGFLLSTWINHFIQSLQYSGGISAENPHLLILDGHNLHVTIEVVAKAKEVGLHLVTLPSHTSHALQPLDVSVFEPFKRAFRIYCDI
jgi:hypothetical protein